MQGGAAARVSGDVAAQGGMLTLRAICAAWAAIMMLIVLLPAPDFGGLNISSPTVQGLSFAVGAGLLALADRRRPHWLAGQSSRLPLVEYFIVRFKRHLIRIAVILIGYAALLAIAQYVRPGGAFHFAQFWRNTAWIFSLAR